MLTHLTALPDKLQRALRHAQKTCVYVSNRIDRILDTGNWSLFLDDRMYHSDGAYKKCAPEELSDDDKAANSILNLEYGYTLTLPQRKWYYVTNEDGDSSINNNYDIKPLAADENPLLHIDSDHKLLFLACLITKKNRYGNCGSQSVLVAQYLWEHCQDIFSIKVLRFRRADHVFVAVNLCGDISDCNTWQGGWIVDPWINGGIIFPAAAFRNKLDSIHADLLNQTLALKALGIDKLPIPKQFTKLSSCYLLYGIDTRKDKYPSYDPQKKVDDYYEVVSKHPAEGQVTLEVEIHYQKVMVDLQYQATHKFGLFSKKETRTARAATPPQPKLRRTT